MSGPRPFRRVLREEHSRQVFLFVWSGMKSLCVRETTVYYSCWHSHNRDNKALCCVSGSGSLQRQTGYPAHCTRILLVLPPGLLRLAAPSHDEATPLLTPHPPNPSAAGSQRQNLLRGQIPRSCYLMLPCTSSCSNRSVGLKCNGAKSVIQLVANIIWDADDPFIRTNVFPPYWEFNHFRLFCMDSNTFVI